MSKLNKIWGKFTSWIKETKFLLQLPIYEIVQCARKYESMAAKGWHLKKRGAYLDCYKRGKPIQQQYRFVFCKVKAFDGIQELSDDQLDSYSERGWSKVCKRKGVYVFSAPQNGHVEELFMDLQEQIEMLKSVHNYLDKFGITFSYIIVVTFVMRLIFKLGNLLSWVGVYEADWLLLLLLVSLLYIIWRQCYGRLRCHALIRQLKKGNPLRHPNSSKNLVGKVINSVLCVLVSVCIIGTVVMIINMRKSDLPEAGKNVPYLLGEDFLNGKRSNDYRFGSSRNNEVKVTHGLLSDYYNTYEYIELNDGGGTSIYQDCFILRGDGSNAINLAKSLAKYSLFRDDFDVIQYDGFDYMLTGPYTVVAVKGQNVIRVSCIGVNGPKAGLDSVLNALANKWK